MITLNKLKIDHSGIVKRINCEPEIKRRLFDLGLIVGTKVKPVLRSPLGDPVAYEIRGSTIALRKEDSSKILLY